MREHRKSYLRLDNLPVSRNIFSFKFPVCEPGHSLSLQLGSCWQSLAWFPPRSHSTVRRRNIESGEVRHGQPGAGGAATSRLLAGDVGDACLDVLVRSQVEKSVLDSGEFRRGGRVGVAQCELTALTAGGLRRGQHGGGQRLLLEGGVQPHQGRRGVGQVGWLQ